MSICFFKVVLFLMTSTNGRIDFLRCKMAKKDNSSSSTLPNHHDWPLKQFPVKLSTSNNTLFSIESSPNVTLLSNKDGIKLIKSKIDLNEKIAVNEVNRQLLNDFVANLPSEFSKVHDKTLNQVKDSGVRFVSYAELHLLFLHLVFNVIYKIVENPDQHDIKISLPFKKSKSFLFLSLYSKPSFCLT